MVEIIEKMTHTQHGQHSEPDEHDGTKHFPMEAVPNCCRKKKADRMINNDNDDCIVLAFHAAWAIHPILQWPM